jgi:hypothetical protein
LKKIPYLDIKLDIENTQESEEEELFYLIKANVCEILKKYTKMQLTYSKNDELVLKAELL